MKKRKKESDRQKRYVETREDFFVRGHNALESAVFQSDRLGNLWGRRGFMEWEKVKFILSTLNKHGIRYAVIGSVAIGHYALPRTTQDLDVLVSTEDLAKLRDLFRGYYKGGTTAVQVYDIEGTRLDVLPAGLLHRKVALRDIPKAGLKSIFA